MSHPLGTTQDRFVQLDALRFFFAVVVVMVHTIGPKFAPIQGGFAVDFFFVLSGFVLSHALICRPASAAQFAWARLARLYPLHLLTLAWLLCLVAGVMDNPPRQNSLSALGLNLVLLQGAWALDSHAWNFPSWSISVEFLVNLLILYPIVRARTISTAAIVVALSWLAIVWLWGPAFDALTVQSIPGTFVAGGLLRGAGGILLGYLLYEAYLVLRLSFGSARRAIWLATGFEVGAIVLLGFCLWVGGTGWELLPVPLSAILILQMATIPGHVSRLLQSTPFALLGHISYSIYLIHIPLFAMLVGVGLLEARETSFQPIWFVYFTLLLFLSALSFHYVERPAQRGLMRLFRGWRTTASHETPA